MNMLSSGDAEIPDLVRLVEKDPAFGIEILRLANSPLCCANGGIKSLTQAIAQVGFTRLRSLTITIALRSVMKVALTKPIVRQCWTHSLASALIARKFARPARVDEDEAYTLGLLHDVGRLGLLAGYPDEYGGLLARTYRNQAEVMAAEETLIGLDHCRAGALLAEHWNLSGLLVQVASGHHRIPDPESPAAIVLIHLSCQLADCLGFGMDTREPPSVEDILAIPRPEVAEAISDELPDLNVNLINELNALRLC